MKEKKSEKSKAHQRYKTLDGTIVPGVTTITGLRAKPQLIPWANKLGLQGIDSSKYTDEKAEIGTIGHYLILCHLKNETPDLKEYSQTNIDKAENAFLKFLAWEKNHKLEPILTEGQLVSERLKFGGCVDFYGKVDGELALVDFKTGGAIYGEMFYQLAGYKLLLTEAGHIVNNQRILRIGRTEDEGFEEKIKTDISREEKIFLDLLDVYYLEKELRNG